MKDKTLKRLRTEINRIFIEEWDPIGVKGIEEARDEYASYVPGVLRLLIDGADAERISGHLFELERSSMGLSRPNADSCNRAALALRELVVTKTVPSKDLC